MIGARSYIRDVCETLRQQPRYLWIVCAATSLLTSRPLFVEANLNYPAHFHFIHFAAVAVYLVGSGIWNRRKAPEESSSLPATSWLLLALLACFMALSVGCTLQAILHFQNTTGLLMLTTASCLIEMLILLISGKSARRQDWVWVGPLAMGCAGILAGEYRLLVKGLRAALPAVLFTGISRAVYSMAADRLTNTDWDRRRFDILFCCSGIAISGAWLYYFTEEPWKMALAAFRWKHTALVAGNIASSAVAMILGKSMLLPMLASEHHTTSGYRNETRTRDTITILLLTGITGVLSSFTLHRSYTTYVQFGAFVAAILCFGGTSVKESIRKWRGGSNEGYAKVAPSIELGLADDEGTTGLDDTEWSGETRVPAPTERTIGTSTGALVIVLTLASLWFTFPFLNFQEKTLPNIEKVKPVMDLTYKATLPVEIVISMYKEPIDDVGLLISTLREIGGLSEARAIIYVKDADANLSHIRKLTKADNVTVLPNVGREGETYLYHILNRWDSLAQQTFFLQAGVHNPREFYPRIENYFVPKRTGMLSLGWTGQVCNCHSCTDHWQFYDHTHLFPAIHDRINNSTECTNVLLSYKGQFVVSAARIRGVPIDVYQDLREAFVNKDSWAHQQEFLRGSGDSMAAPRFGYVMERMWNLLFQCADGDVGWKCPTLLSGWRIGGNKEDCQCFDDDV